MAFKEDILQNSRHRVWSREEKKHEKGKKGVQSAGFMNRWNSFRWIWWKRPRWLHALLGSTWVLWAALPTPSSSAYIIRIKLLFRTREVSVFEHRLHFCLERILCVYFFWLGSAFSLGGGKKEKKILLVVRRDRRNFPCDFVAEWF